MDHNGIVLVIVQTQILWNVYRGWEEEEREEDASEILDFGFKALKTCNSAFGD